MVQEKIVSISTTVGPDTGGGLQPFLWEVVDGIVSPDADGGLTDSRSGGSTARTGGSTRTGGTIRGSTTASVNPSGGGSSSTITLPANQIYVDLYPNRGEINVFSTSGNLSNPQSFVDVKKEIVVFSNTDRVGLRYGDISNESITLIGGFLDVNGNVVSPNFNVDGGTFEVVSSVVGYGAVEVTYSTTKKRYLFEFVGSCPASIPVDIEGNEEEVFEQATLLALWQGDDELRDATLDVTNPNSRCANTGNGNITIIYPDVQPVGFKIEHQSTGLAVAEIGDLNTFIITKLRVYPGGLLTVSDVVGPAGSTVDLSGSALEEEVVKDYLQFQNTFQQTMNKPIVSGLGLSPSAVTGVVDQFGNNVSVPNFAVPGERVEEVEWKDSNIFTSSGNTFTVPLGVIISTSSGNKTLPITGTCQMSYTATYDDVFIRRRVQKDTGTQTVNGVTTVKNEMFADAGTISMISELDGAEIAGTFSMPRWNGGNNGRT